MRPKGWASPQRERRGAVRVPHIAFASASLAALVYAGDEREHKWRTTALVTATDATGQEWSAEVVVSLRAVGPPPPTPRRKRRKDPPVGSPVAWRRCAYKGKCASHGCRSVCRLLVDEAKAQ